MHRRPLARKDAAIAEIDDMLARYAKQPRGVSRGDELGRSFHDTRISRNTKNTTLPILGAPQDDATPINRLLSCRAFKSGIAHVSAGMSSNKISCRLTFQT